MEKICSTDIYLKHSFLFPNLVSKHSYYLRQQSNLVFVLTIFNQIFDGKFRSVNFESEANK